MRWSDTEIEFLSNQAGYLNFNQLCQHLQRSKTAIKLFMTRHGISFYSTIYTYTLLSKELGKSRATLRKYYNQGWLIGKPATWKSVYGKTPMLFTEPQIVNFLKTRYYILDYRQIPNQFFRNIVKDASQSH